MNFGGVEIRREAIHTTADGRRLLVLHGDEFDAIMLCASLARLRRRRRLRLADAAQPLGQRGAPPASTCPTGRCRKHAKHKVKNAVEFISRFEEVVAHAAAERGVDGVVCGHIHTAEIREFGDVDLL